jgi:hypothetical protein
MNPDRRMPTAFDYGIIGGVNYNTFGYRASHPGTWAIRKDQLWDAVVSVGNGGGWIENLGYVSSRYSGY